MHTRYAIVVEANAAAELKTQRVLDNNTNIRYTSDIVVSRPLAVNDEQLQINPTTARAMFYETAELVGSGHEPVNVGRFWAGANECGRALLLRENIVSRTKSGNNIGEKMFLSVRCWA